MTRISILWFRQDLRLADQAALVAAAGEGAVLPVYILDDETPGDRRMGGASRWWLHHSLAALGEALEARGSRLILRRGRCAEVLAALAVETGARRVHATHHHERWWKAAETAVAERLDLRLWHANHLAPPGTVRTGTGKRYKIFTPWWKSMKDHMPPPRPLPPPETIAAPSRWPASDTLDAWGLLPVAPNWAAGFEAAWTPGEDGARQALKDFVPRIAAYDHDRNFPARDGVSRLSPHLHFGEISPATVWYVCAGHAKGGAEPYLREVGWRDFANELTDQIPDHGERNGRARFDNFPWRSGADAEAEFDAWTKGRTGYPIVDAGMRELWATGWMHNRVRMIAASFLVKHLLIDWRRGERWFWDTLVDADYGNNALGWQWTAGTGVDSAPWYRIMAPLAQSEKFDAGDYIRRWVPELAHIRGPAIHDPHEHGLAPEAYPKPLIGHRAARERALEAGKAVDAPDWGDHRSE